MITPIVTETTRARQAVGGPDTFLDAADNSLVLDGPHKLRRAMVLPGRELLTGTVESTSAASAACGPASTVAARQARRSL